MFNKYYMFNKETDEKIQELGFVFNIEKFTYEMICYDKDMVVKYTINKVWGCVYSQRLYLNGVYSNICKRNLEGESFYEIVRALSLSLDDLDKKYNKGDF